MQFYRVMSPAKLRFHPNAKNSQFYELLTFEAENCTEGKTAMGKRTKPGIDLSSDVDVDDDDIDEDDILSY